MNTFTSSSFRQRRHATPADDCAIISSALVLKFPTPAHAGRHLFAGGLFQEVIHVDDIRLPGPQFAAHPAHVASHSPPQ